MEVLFFVILLIHIMHTLPKNASTCIFHFALVEYSLVFVSLHMKRGKGKAVIFKKRV